jgi:hypothetical protein
MAQITLRGIDPQIVRKIRLMARKSGKSLNRIVLDMINQHTGLSEKGKRPATDSLRKLAGGWSEKDALEFLDSTKSCEQIDEVM